MLFIIFTLKKIKIEHCKTPIPKVGKPFRSVGLCTSTFVGVFVGFVKSHDAILIDFSSHLLGLVVNPMLRL
jgi:hypothetical protein